MATTPVAVAEANGGVYPVWLLITLLGGRQQQLQFCCAGLAAILLAEF